MSSDSFNKDFYRMCLKKIKRERLTIHVRKKSYKDF